MLESDASFFTHFERLLGVFVGLEGAAEVTLEKVRSLCSSFVSDVDGFGEVLSKQPRSASRAAVNEK